MDPAIITLWAKLRRRLYREASFKHFIAINEGNLGSLEFVYYHAYKHLFERMIKYMKCFLLLLIMFCIGKRVTLSTVNPIYMNRSHKFCDNNLITWKVYWNIFAFSQVLHIMKNLRFLCLCHVIVITRGSGMTYLHYT
jgi:hypothetical protein